MIWSLSISGFVNKDEIELILAKMVHTEFVGCEEAESGLILYFYDESYAEDFRAQLPPHLFHQLLRVEDQNWNALWESNYAPVIIDQLCCVKATFHEIDTSDYPYVIIIDPKMAFGTGHHETTKMMILHMAELDMKEARVLDFGTGTGVLAIFAELLGARHIIGIESHIESVENARENILLNHCQHIRILHGDTPNILEEQFDIVLVNILRSVIVEQFREIVNVLCLGGQVILSGYHRSDRPIIVSEAHRHGLLLISSKDENQWASDVFAKV